jgi:hypothetical protein
MWGQKTARLIGLDILDAKEVQENKTLIEYDTLWDDNGNMGYYDLPKTGKLIQLIFVGNEHVPFCTLRTHTPAKYEYYKNQVGMTFEIEITEE